MGLLEPGTSGIGEELTTFGGYLSTRLTAVPSVGTLISSALATASSVAGTTITLSSGTFGAVVVGQRFTVLSGPRKGEFGIVSGGGGASITLSGVGVGGALSSVDWKLESLPDTEIDVESTINQSTEGEIYIESQKYSYTGKTPTTLTGLSYEDPKRARGRITFASGASITDGQLITVDDGLGNVVTFEYDDDAAWTDGNTPITFTGGDTVSTILESTERAWNASELAITFFPVATGVADLVHTEDGTVGNIPIVSTVTSFTVVGMSHGQEVTLGVAEEHPFLSEVLYFTRATSCIELFRRAFLVATAEGADLSVLGANIGVPRPPGLNDDDLYRELIQLVAYGYKGTRNLIEDVLEEALGTGNWDILEDFDSNLNRLFLRIANDPTEKAGRAFVDGGTTRQASTATEIDINTFVDPPPLAAYSIRLADDPGERLIASGSGVVGTVNGTVATGPASSFPTSVTKGDVMVITSGPLAGARGTIVSRTSATVVTLIQFAGGKTVGYPVYSIGQNWLAADWKIVRYQSSFREIFPTDEVYIEYDGDTGTTQWDSVTTGAGGTPGHTTDANDESYLTINTTGPDGTYVYRHRARVQPESEGSFSVTARASGTPGTASTDGLQWTAQIRDGERSLAIGMIGTGSAGVYSIGFINASTGAFLAGGVQYNTASGSEWQRVVIEKRGRNHVRLLRDGAEIDSMSYSSFVSSTATELVFGNLNSGQTTLDYHCKEVNWGFKTAEEYGNVRVDDGDTTATDVLHVATPGTGESFIDPDDVGRLVRINTIAASNASGGNARGLWEIDSVTDPNTAVLIGPTRKELETIGTLLPRRVRILNSPSAFVYPDNLGCSIEILTGPNAGTYVIDKFLDPVSEEDIALTLTPESALSSITYTNVIEITTDLPDPADDTLSNWRLVPAFPTDAGPVVYELVGTTTYSSPTFTTREDLPITPTGGYAPLYDVLYSTVLSSQVQAGTDVNDLLAGPSTYDFWPFYLYDPWGWLRGFVDKLTVAGVLTDFDHLFRNDSGLHILED